MTNDRLEHLHFLKSQAVSAIIFLPAYLQVELTGATLTCNTWPVVLGAAADFTYTNRDYKNELCLLLNQTIENITETANGLVLTFDDRELLFELDGTRELLVIANSDGEWHSYPDGTISGF